MNVSLSSALEEFVRRKVALGQFDTVDEVVCEGLRLLQEHDDWKSDASRNIDAGWDEAKSDRLRTPQEARANLAEGKQAWKH